MSAKKTERPAQKAAAKKVIKKLVKKKQTGPGGLLDNRKFKDKIIAITVKAAMLGMDNKEIANLLDITEETFYKWSRTHPEFKQAIKLGREEKILEVASALYDRAIGMRVKEELAVTLGGEGGVNIVQVEKYYPPDVKACQYILSTQAPEKWNPIKIIEIEGHIENEQIIVYELPDNKRDARKITEIKKIE